MNYRVVEIRGCCSPCWAAKCTACGGWLTKHDFTPEDAAACAEHVLARPPGAQFAHNCPKADAELQLELA